MGVSDGAASPLRDALGAAAFDVEQLRSLLLRPALALPVPGAEDRDTWDPAAGNLDGPAVRRILAAAEAERAAPWPQPLASQAARVHRDGDRVAWEQPAFARQERLSRAIAAAAVTLDDRWIDEVADGVVLLCEQSSWCWPAHDDALARHSSVLAEVIRLVLEGLDRYVAALPADGAVDEGYGYWWNGACRALEALDVLRTATAGRLDPIGSVPRLRATVGFPHAMHLGGPWYASLADAQALPPDGQRRHALHRVARHVGGFIIACDGVPVVIDAGRPTYTAATSGPDRYSTWTMQSNWHYVPEVAGEAQRAGRQYAATGTAATIAEDGAELALELGAAYPVPALRHWRRRVRLCRGTPAARVMIEDSWAFSAVTAQPTVVRMLAAGGAHRQARGALVRPLGGARTIRLSWPLDVPATLVRRELDDPLMRDVWGETVTRIDLAAGQRTELTVTAEVDAPSDKDGR